MLTIDIITLFPSMFSGPFAESIVNRAQKQNLVKINIHNLRDWAVNEHGTVDDRPYGGGKGMILRPEPIFNAVKELKNHLPTINYQLSTILLTPQGRLFDQEKAKELTKLDHLILICGHYEGVDERVRQHLAHEEISIGDYILSGGEIPAMVVTDTVIRLIPGVLEEEATSQESFQSAPSQGPSLRARNDMGLLEHPQYTRPEDFRGLKVPEILLSGNHEEIKRWQKRKAVERTKARRPDLLSGNSNSQIPSSKRPSKHLNI